MGNNGAVILHPIEDEYRLITGVYCGTTEIPCGSEQNLAPQCVDVINQISHEENLKVYAPHIRDWAEVQSMETHNIQELHDHDEQTYEVIQEYDMDTLADVQKTGMCLSSTLENTRVKSEEDAVEQSSLLEHMEQPDGVVSEPEALSQKTSCVSDNQNANSNVVDQIEQNNETTPLNVLYISSLESQANVKSPKRYGRGCKGGKLRNFAMTNDGKEAICEVCESRVSYAKLDTLKYHISTYHGLVWSKYIAYIEIKGEKGSDLMIQDLRKKSETHRINRIIKRMGVIDPKKLDGQYNDDTLDDKVMCPLCDEYGDNTAENVFVHVRKMHKTHSDKVKISRKLLALLPNHRMVQFSGIAYQDAKELSKVKSGQYKCVVCFRNIKIWETLRIHVLSSHNITWFEYVEVLYMADGAMKTRTISNIIDRSKVEKEKLASTNKPEDNFKVFKYQGVDVITPVTKTLQNPLFCPECYEPQPKGDRLFKHIVKDHASHPNLAELLLKADDSIYEKALRKRSGRSGVQVTCVYCNRERVGGTFIYHMKRCHRDEPDFAIRLAEVKQSYLPDVKKEKYRSERIRVANGKPQSHPCQYCGHIFAFRRYCTRHECYYCPNNPTSFKFKCPVCCNYRAATQKGVDDHIKRQHIAPPTNKTYTCDLCDKVSTKEAICHIC